MIHASPPPAIVSPSPGAAICADGKPANREAMALRVMVPEYPQSWMILGRYTINVIVSLDATGKAVNTTVLSRSADLDNKDRQDELDRRAMQAARDSVYSPKFVNCKGVQASYIFVITFAPRPR